ncbi:bifunctional folylpolyglutamate synthase/dihydrofolate synthase [Dyadobacter frigoris]|uniref:Dihydrofolate synthase/folylpolyglutamate synthase n=1 Tax=Dyadobacter frigoris TaxID=2576211 RepID=A0A4U6CUY4_9BACT|nr:folylpolyglutamate synthase/dihydrofolate synthase family protein [Dyadobacter frigoris]TKT87545.1 bifunctional folylpolyglutamate synthase/dihydrofolate synthase [Dyadobacter frigoris]GLU52196.1 folylpolyglutamate synthase [Dyadobacter frigoris]
MNYQETIDYLYSRLPVFQNIGARAFKPGLHTTLQLCNHLGNPQEKFKTIHVGGTNGKGSTSHMLASVLQEAGYKVGLYTSPHLKSFTERIRVSGASIDEDFIVEFTAVNKSYIESLSPSFFEVTVAMAFSYFERCQVDVAVIEVGMGGRLDSTNIITPVLSVITNVSFDHVQFLGDTLGKIAFEKAGIIKNEVPVVISEKQEIEISNVFDQTASERNSEIDYGADLFEISNAKHINGALSLNIVSKVSGQLVYPDLNLDLAGEYQLKNICGVLAAIEKLQNAGFEISKDALYKGLSHVQGNTGLKGRWQKLYDKPLVYCDTAHNYAGVSETMKQFNSLVSKQKRFVIGFVSDKDISSILNLFPGEGIYYFCQPSNLRALDASELQQEAFKSGLKGNVYPNVNLALEAAILESDQEDTIYVGGSTFVVADLDQL